MQALVHGRVDGVSMVDGDLEEEPEVQSRLSVVEEGATYDPEDHRFADDDDCTRTGNCCESTTKVTHGSTPTQLSRQGFMHKKSMVGD